MIDIVATVGPASSDFQTLRRMASSGMTVGRVNMKYASHFEVISVKAKLDRLGVKLLVDVLNHKQALLIKDVNFDYVAIAFAESAGQILKLRNLLGSGRKIIAKIESRRGVKNIRKIIAVSDGLMVARGDLGRHVRLEELPVYQKRIINECNRQGKYVITATEMLLSMVSNDKPTKAEVSDVANAVLDGSNALMLSEETAIGRYPVKAVKIMRKVINAALRIKDKF